MKIIYQIVLFIFIIITTSVTVEATTITVGSLSGNNYTSIQEAVNDANSGDIVLIYPSVYTENIDIDKPVIIKSRSKNPEDSIVASANASKAVFQVDANNVTIQGLTITGAHHKFGIHINGGENCIVDNNLLLDNWGGIYTLNSGNNTFRNNMIKQNGNYGIFIVKSFNNNLTNNIVVSNQKYGICLDSSTKNTLTDNNVSNNEYGIHLLDSSKKNVLSNNTMFNNKYNFADYSGENNIDISNLVDGKKFIISEIFQILSLILPRTLAQSIVMIVRTSSLKNLILDNNTYGVYLYRTNNCSISNITSSHNHYGICLENSKNNKMMNNTVQDNFEGIKLGNSQRNSLKNNRISNNEYGISVDSSQNNSLNYNYVFNNSVGIGQSFSDNTDIKGNIASKNRSENNEKI